MRILILLFTMLLMFISCAKDEPDVYKTHRTHSDFLPFDSLDLKLKVVTQNVGWLTDPGNGYEDEMFDIGYYLGDIYRDADVLILTECFTTNDDHVSDYEKFKEIIGSHTDLNFATDYLYANNDPSDKGHGIWIFSKFPILKEVHHYFNSCHGGLLDCASDCLAKKGFVRVTLDLKGNRRLYVVGTHLDAGNCNGDLVARFEQMDQLNIEMRMANLNPKFPFLICGDLNEDGLSTNQYFGYNNVKFGLNGLASWDNFEDNFIGHHEPTSPNGKLLDYIMISNDHIPQIRAKNSLYRVNKYPVINKLSDHFTVSDVLEFKIK